MRPGISRPLRALVALLLFTPGLLDASGATRPNVLIIVSDDQGYIDAGFQGGKDVPTPHLDRLARSGVRCTNGYASHPFCSPTRAALLTGRYQARFGHENNPVYDPLDEKEGLPLSERLLPQIMKTAGYHTGWIGKWHLGSSRAHLPSARGFDETYGFVGGGHRYRDWQPDGRQYFLPLIRQGAPQEHVPPHLTLAFGAEAADFIRRHDDDPWFLYLAFNAPHTPHEPTPERAEHFSGITNAARRKYLAQVSLMDDAIGTVTAALAQTGQTERTLIFFFSDNGGARQSGSDNGPLREQKGTVYEGGVRVPYLVSWPGKVPAGQTYDAPVCTFDAFATALTAAGIAMPNDKTYDSIDLLPFFSGETKSLPHERLFWRVNRAATGQSRAVREGHWKLVRHQDKPAELYDLTADTGEATNLAARESKVTAHLSAALDAWDRELIEPVFPGSLVKNEDWGPGGANEKRRQEAARAKGVTKKVRDRDPGE